MTEVEAAKLLTMLITAWPDGLRWLTEEQQTDTRQLYRTFMLDLDYAAGNAAVTRLIATWRPTAAARWPTIADIRAAAALYTTGRAMTGGEAWGALRKLQGPRRPAALYDAADAQGALLLRAADALGWIVWETSPVTGARSWRVVVGHLVDDHAADRARYIELYDRLAHTAAADDAVGQLAPPISAKRLAASDPLALCDIVARLLPKGSK